MIRVPSNYKLIQTAIDAAQNGDSILVSDGIYRGEGNFNIDFRGKAITVKSVNGPNNCIIECLAPPGVDSIGFNFVNGEGPNTVLSGFSITKASYYAINCRYSSRPSISNCIISGGNGGGIFCSSSPTITNCTINAGNRDGVQCNGASPTLNSCWIQGSKSSGISCLGSSPVITRCIISSNNSSGILCRSESAPFIVHSVISNNKGSGIYSVNSSPIIEGCRIINNSSYEVPSSIYYTNGGGIYSEYANIAPITKELKNINISHCYIAGNKSNKDGGGIFLRTGYYGFDYYENPKITNCIIVDNIAEAYGGGIAFDDRFSEGFATVVNCTISGNLSNISGGGIYNVPTILTITNSIVWGNLPDNLAPFKTDYFVTYSDIENGHGGEGNIVLNPLFIGNGDYHLSELSPCIDKGTSINAPNTDIDYNIRPIGMGFDIGADEFSESIPEPQTSPKAKAMPWIPLLLLDE